MVGKSGPRTQTFRIVMFLVLLLARVLRVGGLQMGGDGPRGGRGGAAVGVIDLIGPCPCTLW